jgi:hypothetical protein
MRRARRVCFNRLPRAIGYLRRPRRPLRLRRAMLFSAPLLVFGVRKLECHLFTDSARRVPRKRSRACRQVRQARRPLSGLI